LKENFDTKKKEKKIFFEKKGCLAIPLYKGIIIPLGITTLRSSSIPNERMTTP
jgi:hypothetical protein